MRIAQWERLIDPPQLFFPLWALRIMAGGTKAVCRSDAGAIPEPILYLFETGVYSEFGVTVLGQVIAEQMTTRIVVAAGWPNAASSSICEEYLQIAPYVH